MHAYKIFDGRTYPNEKNAKNISCFYLIFSTRRMMLESLTWKWSNVSTWLSENISYISNKNNYFILLILPVHKEWTIREETLLLFPYRSETPRGLNKTSEGLRHKMDYAS